MTRLHETILTSLPVGPTFGLIADFAHAQDWDPGVATSVRVEPGPLGIGSRYQLGVRVGSRVVPMEYRITTFEPDRRVILTGSGSNISVVDEIRFEELADGTRIDYTADIHLGGWMRLVEPLAGGAFRKIARNALEGMQRYLDGQVVRPGTSR
ncbi:MAG: SRPBCC family protein [Candidatus Limnocylindrales bacterium]